MLEKQRWGTRLGLILAVAGNAIGLGNFLRFPVQAAKHHGGAFMIPYFISFLLLGIPLMWTEWSIGRYGGTHGYGTSPGMFQLLWKNRIAKYLGVIGIAGPLAIVIYYSYIASWTVGYSIFSLFKKLPPVERIEGMEKTVAPFSDVLLQYIGTGKFFLVPSFFAYVVFTLTLLVSVFILARGISRGIELLAKIAMPLLFLFAVFLVIRVMTLGSPVHHDYSPLKGLAFLWEPNFSQLLNLDIWLSAAGQIFFTLSLGMGIILTYTSYLREKDDIALSGLTTASTNEFTEVVLGASIAIPATVVIFGVSNAEKIAQEGAFQLAFVSMPAILSFIPQGNLFGFFWFCLLFFAGITSIVGLAQPAIAFLEEEFLVKRKHAAWGIGGFIFLSSHIPIFVKGTLDELDFWVGTFCITVFATIEIILFFWVFGSKKAWREMNKGAEIPIPRIFFYICKYVTPVILLAISAGWMIQFGWQEMIQISLTKWIARSYLIFLFVITGALVHISWKRRRCVK
ncbi:MAG: sodium-dependent transporter [Candidatus Brocadiaceae bacterium]|nr:sodium-dependent transporter [Candidatus Brocadiaceae bacterium]